MATGQPGLPEFHQGQGAVEVLFRHDPVTQLAIEGQVLFIQTAGEEAVFPGQGKALFQAGHKSPAQAPVLVVWMDDHPSHMTDQILLVGPGTTNNRSITADFEEGLFFELLQDFFLGLDKGGDAPVLDSLGIFLEAEFLQGQYCRQVFLVHRFHHHGPRLCGVQENCQGRGPLAFRVCNTLGGIPPEPLVPWGSFGQNGGMVIQWFPGHMTKAKRLIAEQLKTTDVVLEVLDARAPQSCRNPLLDELVGERPRIVLLNKIDLADPHVTGEWKRYYESLPQTRALLVSATKRKNLNALSAAAQELCREKSWYSLRPVRGLIVGIPNVGKSSLINALSGHSKASVAPQPGHTRNIQRIKIDDHFDLLDSPGVLWHKFEDASVGLKLALLGSIKDDILDLWELTLRTLDFLKGRYPAALAERYGLKDLEETDNTELFEALCRRRGFIGKKAAPDYERGIRTLFQEFRDGTLGQISLEAPQDSSLGPLLDPYFRVEPGV